VGRCLWHRPPGTPDLLCRLPSGRELRYRQARIDDLPSRWDPGTTRAQVTYLHRGESRRATYGGKLAENCTQAVCRDILADALVRLEAAGLPVVLHVHDEAVCEVEREADLARVEAIMREAPPWAAGLPVEVKGHVGGRYGG
jgi:DNA polymerase